MMYGKATKKPIPIDWCKWDGDDEKLFEWVDKFDNNRDDNFDHDGCTLKVKTLEGTSYDVPEGYIIIRGIKGEYYPCDPVIFEESYNASEITFI